ncbi:acetyl-CoA carboxylase biotin carboxyl carrier protein [Paenibacillus cellulosilyticus]|uniref:Biotin carboxyl carrier protein of acetyl-CoA carboxylase n=1 Tax=Paenibacillus cellulosilyticus TaxID=375489 RepID=A0A2V2YWB2_9BACL|nr:acetyl-CoA carboxylase biotin carboxyl carrier protein [Paenibacillus cellulosilyticus]PWW05656.1 acetyl-CoA carboxylase biotin carboxyl carrier protein [Paenibacillus cellulosilyticus]QKS45319.1 acetyl-CoA carboxylase biotin carboxyl carrier protein [Paenibacillus cellulosilyticus]
MFKLNEIKELIKLIDQSTVQEVEIENEGTRLLIRKPGKTEVVTVQAAAPAVQAIAPAPVAAVSQAAAPAAAAPAAAPADNLHKIVSPMVGTFYAAPSPEAGPFVQKGSRVSDKSVVCILEAMKLMNEIEAEVRGEIVEVLVENGQLVEFGQPLFLVKPE